MLRVFILLILLSTVVFAADEREIVVGRCKINVIVMETADEHKNGLLGYTERTFPYGGMLFEMGHKGRKYFHTEGMKMPIRIMGVAQDSKGNYNVIGDARYAPPGLESIRIDAPDVLEIPEQQYQLWYKDCLGVPSSK